MIVERTYNRSHINTVLKHPDIYKVISGDLSPKLEDFNYSTAHSIFILGTDNDVLGLAIIDTITSLVAKFHYQVLPDKRKKYAVELHNKIVIHLKKILPDVKKLVAEVPVIYPNVIKFGVKQGWKVEGVNSKSYLKNGQLIDQTYLGIEL